MGALNAIAANVIKTANDLTADEALPYFEALSRVAKLAPAQSVVVPKDGLSVSIVYELLQLLNTHMEGHFAVVSEQDHSFLFFRMAHRESSTEFFYSSMLGAAMRL